MLPHVWECVPPFRQVISNLIVAPARVLLDDCRAVVISALGIRVLGWNRFLELLSGQRNRKGTGKGWRCSAMMVSNYQQFAPLIDRDDDKSPAIMRVCCSVSYVIDRQRAPLFATFPERSDFGPLLIEKRCNAG